MSGGAMGVGGAGNPLGGASGMGSAGSADSAGSASSSPTAYTPSSAAQPPSASDQIYNSLNQPWTASDQISQLYQTALGRAPEASGAAYWNNEAQTKGWSSQDLARAFKSAAGAEALGTPAGQAAYLAANPDVANAIANGTFKGTAADHYKQFGFNEGRTTGTALDKVNPATASTQVLNRPTYYNTNPVGVDYANIFNPAARSVTSNQPVMTPGQQANYLDRWAQSYSNSNRGATEAANAQRIATANQQWDKYFNAQSKAATEQAVKDAVAAKQAEMEQQYSQNSYDGSSNGGWYTGAAGGSVPGGLRSLRGK